MFYLFIVTSKVIYKQTPRLHSKSGANIRLGWKWPEMTNTPAYNAVALMTT
jgi:hypothetical protein